MDEGQLVVGRTLMGQGIASIAADPRFRRVEAGWWCALTGAPSPDMNLALLHSDDPSALGQVLSMVADADCPALVMLAGAGRDLASSLPDVWQDVGSMPMMTLTLGDAQVRADARVRRASADDVEALTEVLAAGFGMQPEHVAALPAVAGRDDLPLDLWLLEEEGHAVSMVATGLVGDAVSVWAMATPPQFTRRGYGSALLSHVLHAAARTGATHGWLGATPAGFPMYEGTGWRTVEEWQIFTNSSSVQFTH